MRSIEDKGCYYNNNGVAIHEVSSNNSNGASFEFHKGNGGHVKRASAHHRTALGKPTPSKWDDAQKWLVGLSRNGGGGGGGGGGGDKAQSKSGARDSNADDLRLIAPVPQKEQDYLSSEGEEGEERKNIECDDSGWIINKPPMDEIDTTSAIMRSVCVRDMGTDMTPIASQEPSRTATPIRATTPAGRSPIASGSSTPARFRSGMQPAEGFQSGLKSTGGVGGANRTGGWQGSGGGGEESTNVSKVGENINLPDSDQVRKMSSLESRAIAWDEAERAKYTARYKREEVRIQAWENHEKRKAEMEMKRMEAKAERMKARAQEKMVNKVSATRRLAEEMRANAEAKLNEKAVTTCEKADYIRRTGHLPSSFSFSFNFKLPSLCW